MRGGVNQLSFLLLKEITRGKSLTIVQGDCRDILRKMPDSSVHCCVTSPPYWCLRDYGFDGQIGLEETPEQYVAEMVGVFREVRRVLRDDGTLWLNLGDSYATTGGAGTQGSTGQRADRRYTAETGRWKQTPAGLKPKDLIGIPWRVALALQADGWYLRSDIIWSKPNPMPESVRDRPTRAHEYVFLMSKSERYFYDHEVIREASTSDHNSGNGYARPGRISRGGRGQAKEWNRTPYRNARTVWKIAPQPFPEAHFATFPEELVRKCVLAGCPQGGVVLDPFGGSGTTGLVATRMQRRAILVEMSQEYCKLAQDRCSAEA